MKTEDLKRMLAWAIVVNYAILMVWFVVFIFAHDRMRDLHTRWFQISAPQFDLAHYLGMAIYKIGIMLLFLTPYLALRIVERRKE